jgi:hypothetical protein
MYIEQIKIKTRMKNSGRQFHIGKIGLVLALVTPQFALRRILALTRLGNLGLSLNATLVGNA